MATLDVTQKEQIYETLSSLNMAFAGIVQHLKTLQQIKLFNQEFLEDLHQLELEDWGRYGNARQARDKEIADPDDVFIHAEERRKELARQRKKKAKR